MEMEERGCRKRFLGRAASLLGGSWAWDGMGAAYRKSADLAQQRAGTKGATALHLAGARQRNREEEEEEEAAARWEGG